MIAPVVLVGPLSGPAFQAHVEQVLAPTLQPSDTVILEKLPAHELATVRQAIEAMGAERCFLPTLSPDLKPLEMVRAPARGMARKRRDRDHRRRLESHRRRHPKVYTSRMQE